MSKRKPSLPSHKKVDVTTKPMRKKTRPYKAVCKVCSREFQSAKPTEVCLNCRAEGSEAAEELIRLERLQENVDETMRLERLKEEANADHWFHCNDCETEFRAEDEDPNYDGTIEALDNLVCPECASANLSGIAYSPIKLAKKTLTFNDVIGQWEAEATLKILHPSLTRALEGGVYGQSDVDRLRLALVHQVNKQVERHLPDSAKTTAKGEMRDLAYTLHRLANLADPTPSASVRINPDILKEIANLHGPGSLKELRDIVDEKAQRQIDEFRKEHDSANLTSGERYLKQHGKGGYFYPYGMAGEFLLAFMNRLASYFGSQGHVTNRLYDLLKVAGVVPDPGEPWERSRARAVRVELFNVVCYNTMMGITNRMRDRLVKDCRFQTKEELGRDFVDRSQLELWFIDNWFGWMTKAREEAFWVGEFALKTHQFEVWKERTAVLFNQVTREPSDTFTTAEVLVDVLNFCKERVTEKFLAEVPLRPGVVEMESTE